MRVLKLQTYKTNVLLSRDICISTQGCVFHKSITPIKELCTKMAIGKVGVSL